MRRLKRLTILSGLLLLVPLASAQSPLPPPEPRSLPVNQTRYLPDTTLPDSDGDYNGDHYGMTIATDGDWALVGAPHDDNFGNQRGSVDLYKRNASESWEKKASIQSGFDQSFFGTAVAIWDDGIVSLIAGGMPGADKTTPPIVTDAGYVLVYRRTNDNGVTVSEGILNAPVQEANARFGESLAVSGSWLIVGAGGDRHGGVDMGAAYIFQRVTLPSPGWAFKQKLTPPDGASGDLFGSAVAIDTLHGTRVLIGAPGKDVGSSDTGAAYLFQYDSGTATWIADGPRIDSPYGSAGDRFGSAVALAYHNALADAAYFAIGMPGHAGDTGAAAYYYRPVDDNTIPAPVLLAPFDGQPGDFFGASVDVGPAGFTVLVGAPQDTTGALTDAGSLYVYNLADQTPHLVLSGKYIASLAEANDRFGASVAIDDAGEYLVGAPFDTTVSLGTEAGAFYQMRTAGIFGLQLGGTVSEAGGQHLLTVTLASRPTAPVDLILSPDGQCAVSASGGPSNPPGQPLTLSYDTTSGGATSWDTARLVAVTALDDAENEGTHVCTIHSTVISGDSAYNAIVLPATSITVLDNDAVELIANSSFEPGARGGKLSPWKVTGGSGDKVKCGAMGDESDCAFIFKGSAAENSKLTYKINPYPYLLGVNDSFELSFSLSATSAKSKVVAKLKAKFPDGSDASVTRTIAGSTSGVYQLILLTPMSFGVPPSQGPNITVTLNNKSKSGKVSIDNVSLKVLGTAGPRVALPPPATPSSFRRGE